MNDPYAWPDADCLRNRLGIKDPDSLLQIETILVAARETELARETLPGEYNLEHLKAFHLALFHDVYDWAGLTRTVDISKPGARFAHWRHVDDETSRLLHGLHEDGFLRNLRREIVVERLAHYYGELNAMHPFREGNGRTCRAFLRQLTAAVGFRLDWSELSRERNLLACADNLRTASTSLLIEVLDPIVSRL
jgi:cell filamentation protein